MRRRSWLRTAPKGSLLIVVSVLILALFAPWITPSSPFEQNTANRLAPPAWETGDLSHILGTDALGRDLLSRLIYGARISVTVGLCVVAIAGTVGLVMGILAGFFGAAFDTIIMRLTEIQLSIPFIILTLSIMAVFGPGLTNVILVLGIVSWVPYARIVRSQVMVLRELEFIEAATATGATKLRILTHHILPNIIGSAVIVGTLEVARAILSEASLSFLGLGVTPPTPAWGSMISEGRNYLYVAWWVATFPGIAIFLTVLGVNTLGDSLRDYLDPRLRT